MTAKKKEPLRVVATRSFNDYEKGQWYTLDPDDPQQQSLLGAGYFEVPEMTVASTSAVGVPTVVQGPPKEAGGAGGVGPGGGSGGGAASHRRARQPRGAAHGEPVEGKGAA